MARKKRRTAKQIAATKRMIAANKRVRSGKRSPAKKRGRGKLSQATITRIARAENAVPLTVLKRRAIVSAETLVKRMRQAGVTDIADIPDYKPKGRRRR